jgi:thioredoxin
MKKVLFFSVILITLLMVSCTNGQTQNVKTNLTPAEFEESIKKTPNAVLVDVRTPDEFSKGHLVNAKNIDWNGSTFDKEISSIDKSKPVFVYCLSGGRSGQAASKMRADGFKLVYELDGGIMKWRGANLPETTETATQSTGMTKAQFDAMLVTDKVVLVDFYADWCGPCKKMKPYLEEIKSEMADKVLLIRINADDNQALCKEMKIDALPVLLVYKKQVLTWKNLGFIEKEEVVKELD